MVDLLTKLKDRVFSYKGHKTVFSNRDAFYKTAAWVRTRSHIMERDANECKTCADRGLVTTTSLLVHHVKPIEFEPDQALTDNNLIVVCNSCHNYIHSFTNESKGNKWSDEWW